MNKHLMRHLRAVAVGAISGMSFAAIIPAILIAREYASGYRGLVPLALVGTTVLYFSFSAVPVFCASIFKSTCNPSSELPVWFLVIIVPLTWYFAFVFFLRADLPLAIRVGGPAHGVMFVCIAAVFSIGAVVMGFRAAGWYLSSQKKSSLTARERCVWLTVVILSVPFSLACYLSITPTPQRTARSLCDARSEVPLTNSFRDFPAVGPVEWHRRFRISDRWEIQGSVSSLEDYLQWRKEKEFEGSSYDLRFSWIRGNSRQKIEHAGGRVDEGKTRTVIMVFADGRFKLFIEPR